MNATTATVTVVALAWSVCGLVVFDLCFRRYRATPTLALACGPLIWITLGIGALVLARSGQLYAQPLPAAGKTEPLPTASKEVRATQTLPSEPTNI